MGGSVPEWYNGEHHHSAIAYVTPDERHCGLEREILAWRVSSCISELADPE